MTSRASASSRLLLTDATGEAHVQLSDGEYDVAVTSRGFKPKITRAQAHAGNIDKIEVVLETGGCRAYCEEDTSATLPKSALQPLTLATAPAVPDTCSKADIALYGTPVFFQSHNGLTYGLSMPRNSAKMNDELKVYAWLFVDSRPVTIGFCCGQTVSDVLRIADEYGRVLLSEREKSERKALRDGLELVNVCTCASPVRTYQTRECSVVDWGTLSSYYKLSPGTYIALQAPPQPESRPYKIPPQEVIQGSVTGLQITIEP